jgi:hypothetical protein
MVFLSKRLGNRVSPHPNQIRVYESETACRSGRNSRVNTAGVSRQHQPGDYQRGTGQPGSQEAWRTSDGDRTQPSCTCTETRSRPPTASFHIFTSAKSGWQECRCARGFRESSGGSHACQEPANVVRLGPKSRERVRKELENGFPRHPGRGGCGRRRRNGSSEERHLRGRSPGPAGNKPGGDLEANNGAQRQRTPGDND